MVNLILTNTIDSQFILEKLKKDFDPDKKYLIIVPDRVVLSYEMLVLDYLNIKGSFNIEVVSFSRLADLLLMHSNKRMLNSQTQIMLIRKIIDENKSKLLYYKNMASFVGFAQEVLSAINIIRSNGVTPQTMADVVADFPQKYKNKASDILLIYKKYIEEIKENYYDANSKIEILSDIFYDSKYSEYNVYLSEFIYFNQLELDVIKSMMSCVPNITIGIPYSDDKNAHIFPKLKSSFESMAREIGVGVNVTSAKENLADDFELIRKNLYSYSSFGEKTKSRNVNIYKCSDPQSEVENIAMLIKKLIKNGDCRYKDITCVCCDIDSYSTIVAPVFARYDIPYYMDAKSLLVNQYLSKYVLLAGKVILNSYMQSDVLAFIKELNKFSQDDLEQFENYVLKYGVNFEKGFKNELLYGNGSEIAQATKVQKELLKVLAPLDKDKESITVSDYALKFKKFLVENNTEKICSDFAKAQEERGMLVEAAATKQVYSKILEILNNMETMLGGCEMSYAQFFKILETTISSEKISTVPMYMDCVYVGDCKKSVYKKKPYMFVFGANNGVFPKESVQQGIISIQEYLEWDKKGVKLYPDVSESNRIERLNSLMILLKATKGLMISYPVADLSGNELQPTTIIEYLKDIFDIEEYIVTDINNKMSIEEILMKVASRNNALATLINLKDRVDFGILKFEGNVKSIMDVLYAMACEDNGKLVVDKLLNCGYELEDNITGSYKAFDSNKISISKISKYLSCPFKYYTDYVLYLKEREIAGVKVRDNGTILHAIMEDYFGQPDWDTMDQEAIYTSVINSLNTFIDNPDNSAYRYLLEDEYKITYENIIKIASDSIVVLVSKMKSTKFRPCGEEVTFGQKDSKLKGVSIKTGTQELILNGVIDRIDQYEDKYIVIDYKTKGSMSFEDKTVFYGQTLQPVVYLKVLMDNDKNITPAGMYYLLLNNKIKQEEDKGDRLRYVGYSNENLLGDLDFEVFNSQEEKIASALYPIKKDKDKFKGNGIIKGKEEFEMLSDYSMKLMEKAASEIESGCIVASPLVDANKSPCSYCAFKTMCGIDNHEEKIRQMKGKGDFFKSAIYGKEEQ